MNFEVNRMPETIKGHTDPRWEGNTIHNHYNSPIEFMNDVVANKDHSNLEDNESAKEYIDEGIKAYKDIQSKDDTFDTLYEDIASKVKDKLITRGFTTAMLYSTVEFTAENTGVASKQRMMMGRRDFFFKNPSVSDGKLFYDIYINMSYSWAVKDSTIRDNSYALYAFTKELSRVLPMRVIIVNHVGTDIPTCYSYILKQFGTPIKPKEFLFFTSDSKRTFGWATYAIINEDNTKSQIGDPTGTVSIADFDLDKEIDTIFLKLQKINPTMFKVV